MLHYTVWTRGRKIGETRLELRPSPRRRTGAFYPTEFGLTLIPDLRAVPAMRDDGAIEVRDPMGSPMYWESLTITDLAEMVANAKARHPGAATEATATLRESVKYVISLTLGDTYAESSAPGRELFRGSGAAGHHAAAQHRQSSAN